MRAAYEAVIVSGSRWLARFGGVLVLIAVFLVTGDVVTRSISGAAPFFSFEISSYLFAAAVAFGLPLALVERQHVRIDIVYRLFPAPIRAVLDVAAVSSVAVVAITVARYGWDTLAQTMKLGAISNSTLAIPLAIPQGIWVAGLVWFAFVSAILTVAAALALVTGRLATVTRIAGVPLGQDVEEALAEAKTAGGTEPSR